MFLKSRAGRRAARGRARLLAHAVGDFSDLEDGIHFSADGLQFTGALQRRDPIPQIFVGQNLPPFGNRQLYGSDDV